MRIPITLNDVLLLARATSLHASEKQTARCKELVSYAAEAANFVKITGQVHPFYGDGSIASLALKIGVGPLPANLDKGTIAHLVSTLEVVLMTLPDTD